MTNQTLTQIFPTRSLSDLILIADRMPSKPVSFTAVDFGYEINADDLANAFSAYNPGDLSQEPFLQVSPDEFEAIYTWFLS